MKKPSFYSIAFLLCAQFATAQEPQLADYDDLKHLQGYEINLYHSPGAGERAKFIGTRCDRVLEYYKNQIGFDVTVLVLNPEDWGKHTTFPVYGMPHYKNDKTLIVASQDNDFWKSFIPSLDKLPAELANQIASTYSDKNGNLSIEAFFDLLAVHELGHAYHYQGDLTMQRRWMGELFPNIMLHTYIAENEPEFLPALTVFPKMVLAGGTENLKYTSLIDLENRYEEIGQHYPKNYAWYQCS